MAQPSPWMFYLSNCHATSPSRILALRSRFLALNENWEHSQYQNCKNLISLYSRPAAPMRIHEQRALTSDRFKNVGQFANLRLVRCVHSPHSGNFVLGAKKSLDHDLSRIVSLFIRETPIDFIDKRLPTEQKAEIIFPSPSRRQPLKRYRRQIYVYTDADTAGRIESCRTSFTLTLAS